MSLNYRTEEYYQKFIELQEKLRKSEEERLKLEMKFNEMVRITKEETQTHYRKLRSQYKKFLEEDRKRQDRNERIMRTLDRIESRFVGLNAKTERFKLLRQQYQAFLDRIYKMNRKNNKHQDFESKQFPKKEKLSEEKSDVLEQYLQNLSSQRVRDLLKKEEPKGRFPFSLSPVEPLEKAREKSYDDHYDEGDFRPNYANSIASDIMQSIYETKPKSFTPKLHNDNKLLLGRDERDDRKVATEYKVTNTRTRSSDTDDELSIVSGFVEHSNPQLEEIKTVEPVPLSIRGDELRKTKSDGHVLPELVQELTGSRVELLLEKTPSLPSEKLVKNSEEKEENKPKNSDHYKEDFSHIRELEVDENKLETIQGDGKIETRQCYDENKQFTQEFSETKQPTIAYQNPQYDKNGQVVQGNDENGQSVPHSHYYEESQPVQQYIDQHNLNENIQSIRDSGQPIQQYEETTESAQYHGGDQLSEKDQSSQQYVELTEPEYSKSTEGQCNENNIQQYDETGQPLEQYDPNQTPYETDQQYVPQYDENGQLIEPYNEEAEPGEQYDENGQLIQQHIEATETTGQFDEQEQLIQQYDENGPSVGQYDENGQLIQQYIEGTTEQFGEQGQPIQQYDENGQAVGQYDENGQLIQQYDESGQSIGQYYENGQLIQPYDESGQSIGKYDENGQLIQQYDESGQPIGQYDENGQLIQQCDESGQPIGQYDENGQLIQQYNENGEPIEQYDPNGQFSQQYDESGQSIQQRPQYDENGELILQYDENDQPLQQFNEDLQHYENSGELEKQNHQQCDIDQESDQHGDNEKVVQKIEENAETESPKPEEGVVEEKDNKVSNVMTMLDTDTESVKQDTKISNDSDFDFSNG